jgi:hypothetical protein
VRSVGAAPSTIAATARRDEGERCEQPDVPFPQGFTLSNFCEGLNATKPEVFDPSACLGGSPEISNGNSDYSQI